MMFKLCFKKIKNRVKVTIKLYEYNKCKETVKTLINTPDYPHTQYKCSAIIKVNKRMN